MIDWESMDSAYNDYMLNHLTYMDILFKYINKGANSQLHPLFVMSQFIIDSLIDDGKRRIAIVLPDDQCSIIPLVIAKYFQFLQDDPSYATSIFEDIVPGQHVKLGKAVAEFLEIDQENNTIKYKVGKETKLYGPVTISTPISNYHLLLERTEAEVSAERKWSDEVSKIKERLSNQGLDIYLDKFKQKRTGVKKTIILFSQKNNARAEFSNLVINGETLDNVLAYGELVDDSEKPYAVLNKGKLDCLPGISVVNRFATANKAISELGIESVSMIYCAQDKFQEIIDNLDAFKKILKTKIPTTIFVPESEFEKYDVLRDLGFVFWQWKPATLKSNCFSSNPSVLQKSIFSHLACKVNNARKASYSIIRCPSEGLAEIKNGIRNLWKEEIDDVALRRVYIQLNKFHKHLSSICTDLDVYQGYQLYEEWGRVNKEWIDIRERFISNPIKDLVDAVLKSMESFALRSLTNKAYALEKLIRSCKGKVIIVLPDDYYDLNKIKEIEPNKYNLYSCRFLSYSEYLNYSNYDDVVDVVIVPWFDSSKYIKLKQTYCYKRLIYVLYDFENKWRSAFIKRLDSSFSHEDLIQTAENIHISSKSISSVPFDSVDVECEDINPTKEDYDFDRTLLKKAVGKSYSSSDLADSVECIPVILSEDTVAYFGTNHDVIDITGLYFGELSHPEKIQADKLSQGRIILIRQSGRDLVTEKADQLMAKENKSFLREKASVWSRALIKYSEGKTILDVTQAIARAGYSCSFQQVRFWLLGETIRPNDIEAIRAIAKICKDEVLLTSVDQVYAYGGIVQDYHRRAGSELSKELKNRADDILDIVSSGNMKGNVEGIGDIHIYKVEEVMGKEFVPRNRINTLEVFA